MDSCVETVISNSVEVVFDDSSSDLSEDELSDATENFSLIGNNNIKPNDKIYRRVLNYMGKSRYAADCDDIQFYTMSQQSPRQSQNKSFKRFLFLFGFASTIITISLYLSLYYDEPTLQGWDRNRSRNIPTYIHPNVNTTIIQPTTLCRENTPILLLIVICSAADNFENRQIVRGTWANTTEFNYSKFLALHSQFKGKYLPINYPDWKNFTAKNEENHSKENLQQSTERISDKTLENDPSHVNFQVRTVFLVGQTENNETQEQIFNESRIYNDLIQETFFDSYNNLTLKSVMMLKWIVNNCDGKVNFLMKCDDDSFVNIPNLVHFLLGGTIPVYEATLHQYNAQTVDALSPKNRLTRYENLLIGSRFCHSKPIIDYRSKWFAPHYMYDRKTYPNYLSGSGYVFTMDTAEKLYNASLETPLLHLEDVYVTGMCAEKVQIKPINHHLFSYLPYKDWCEFRGMMTLHEIKSSDMKKAYDFVRNPNVTCDLPNKHARIRPLKRKKYCE